MFNQSKLKNISKVCAAKISDAHLGENFFSDPFKHLVIDDFFDISLANACLENFPPLSDASWEHANDADIEVKYRTTWKSEFDIPDGLIEAVRILNSSTFLNAISEKFDIKKIIPDPYFSGGGLNVTRRGGLLDVHVDGNYHDATGLNRRLNAILYLNKDWKPEWGGEFGLYDEDGSQCIKKVEPIFNRLVVFDSHDKSFHGLPEPLSCPEDVNRNSIILYYYTKDPRPADQIVVEKPHSALWKRRGLLDKRGNKERDYE